MVSNATFPGLNGLNVKLRRKVLVILQSESAECGLACIAMIASWHGRQTSILSLRQDYGVSLHGCTLQTLAQVSGELGMASRAFHVDLDELHKLSLPCILHWEFNHFVVLTRVKGNKITLHDPVTGLRTLKPEEFSKSFTGVAFELWPKVAFTRQVKPRRMKTLDLLRNISRLKSVLSKLFLLSLMIEFISLLLPIGTQLIMDHVIPENDRSLLTVICLGLMLMTLLQTGISLWRHWAIITINATTDLQWKDGLFRHLVGLPLAWFEKRKLGDIQSRYFSIDTIRDTFITEITGGIVSFLIVSGSLALLFFYGGTLSFIAVAFTLIYILIRLMTWPVYRQMSEELLVKDASANSYLTETLFSIATVRSQGLEEKRCRNMMNLNVNTTNSSIMLAKFDMTFTLLGTLIGTCEYIIILWLGVTRVLDNQLTLGAWIAFGTFRALFSDRALAFTDTLLNLRMLSLHNERVADIALSSTEPATPARKLFPAGKALSLTTRKLTFRYDKYAPLVINELDLSINAGESVAIVGPSGCGKSTLMRLLCGLTAPESGRIIVDGRDAHQAGINNYRCAIASILQDDKLLSGSLRSNISGFRQEIDEHWLIECAKLSNIHDDISALPMGYDTLVGELGEGLSGGQKQRLFIARALYSRPGILFMDEATSHLDEENEKLINQAIANLGMTRVLVAHRPSTIASAHRVIRL
ncbi:peptidase domain-containing ABC transporter [Enterobacteriaceae bacterium H18W14]|uniref:peptidase domain-containing ABC transporter n=1 Tax=Dryocola boscaweniae TaxID=2925397 RepID=UPI0022F14314|nr:peptidase domain-containing ABC transporter [Dryocola boscaweniae]MCT4716419.1 peptidase domain-containing ABC transporter [Dryocola boscaweniae]